jgi:3,4-dihydroxy 2-butanone 4-phosphate synthase / GTP cyclohydrolase II
MPEQDEKTVRLSRVIADVKRGKPVIIVDDHGRENEADLIISAKRATVSNLTFSMRHAGGLMCIPCMQDTLDRLEIGMMYSNSRDSLETPFANSIDAVHGTTTGMSVYDRLKTIQAVLNPASVPSDLIQPGHMFPLRARAGLLMDRRGHTESSIELMRLAGEPDVAVIIEIMNEDGQMVRGTELVAYANLYDLEIISVEELFEARYGKISK